MFPSHEVVEFFLNRNHRKNSIVLLLRSFTRIHEYHRHETLFYHWYLHDSRVTSFLWTKINDGGEKKHYGFRVICTSVVLDLFANRTREACLSVSRKKIEISSEARSTFALNFPGQKEFFSRPFSVVLFFQCFFHCSFFCCRSLTVEAWPTRHYSEETIAASVNERTTITTRTLPSICNSHSVCNGGCHALFATILPGCIYR